jgi:hypothetical protein
VAIDQSEPGREPASGRPSTGSDDVAEHAAEPAADSVGIRVETTDEVPERAVDPEPAPEPAPEPEPAVAAADAAGPIPRLLRAAWPYVAYMLGAIFLLHNLWADPGNRMLLDNYQDQVWFEWLLTNGANSIANWDNPFFTEKLNAPFGLNLMANTSVLALAFPLAPVTWIFGADVTFVLITTLALAGTASAWFFVLNRLLNHRVAAMIGGAFCGFAPSM